MPIRIGRWQAELHQRAIYIQRQPKSNCPDCQGTGLIETGTGEYVLDYHWAADVEPCPCWNPYRSLRIPLGPRPVERYPF